MYYCPSLQNKMHFEIEVAERAKRACLAFKQALTTVIAGKEAEKQRYIFAIDDLINLLQVLIHYGQAHVCIHIHGLTKRRNKNVMGRKFFWVSVNLTCYLQNFLLTFSRDYLINAREGKMQVAGGI